MGLALLLVILKTMAMRTGNEHYNHAARFWAKIFAINVAMGVVTGIPMEFQFGKRSWPRSLQVVVFCWDFSVQRQWDCIQMYCPQTWIQLEV